MGESCLEKPQTSCEHSNTSLTDMKGDLCSSYDWLFARLALQISDIQVNGQSDDMTAKEKLLLWSQRMVEGYQGLRCDNFTGSWRDGKLFNAIIHKHRWAAFSVRCFDFNSALRE